MSPREDIYEALLALVTRSATFNLSSRRWRPWNDVPTADHPAVFLNQKYEEATFKVRMPTRWQLFVDVIIYAHAFADTDNIPSSALNPLVDAVVGALKPPPGEEEQTLGGLVTYCRVEGRVQVFEGLLGDQAAAFIPVTILTT